MNRGILLRQTNWPVRLSSHSCRTIHSKEWHSVNSLKTCSPHKEKKMSGQARRHAGRARTNEAYMAEGSV